ITAETEDISMLLVNDEKSTVPAKDGDTARAEAAEKDKAATFLSTPLKKLVIFANIIKVSLLNSKLWK
ncbi:hypothetical protein, partial [Escherichia coli]|uniref:hypothetical protein n=1 Tax=Escherichia coli TaxID=562 RepID=UPI001ADD8DBA